MFPKDYTQFKLKTDASYDGDPRGDYVLAEHMNKVQQAIEDLEKSIGLESKAGQSLMERIKALESVQSMRVPSIGYFSGNLGTQTSYIVSVLSNYSIALLSERTATTKAVTTELNQTDTRVFGAINALNNLTLIQNEIGAWKTAGAKGIYLTGFGEDANPTRKSEQDILSSIQQADLSVVISTAKLTQLLDNSAKPSYNPTGAAFVFPKETIIQLNDFAYNERAFTSDELLATTKPLIDSIRLKGLKVVGFSKANTQELFNYVQTAGLLFGIDYLANGPSEGTTIENRFPTYNWPSYLSNWKTNKPAVFKSGASLYRDIPNGRIWLNDDLSIKIDGYELDSDLINWYNDTIPGSSIKEASINPSKLSTYDIQKIVNLINTSADIIKIDASKIKADPGGGNLPINIPASNMTQNVIHAINKKNNIDSLNEMQIENWAIESIDAAKLIGDIKKEQIKTHVIDAINESSSLTQFINVSKMQAIDIKSTGTINGTSLIADNGTLRAVNITEAMTAYNGAVSNYFTGNMGEFFQLYVEQLTVDKLLGLKELHVDSLTANNMGALVLSAIDANITNGTFVNVVAETLKADVVKAGLITAMNTVVGSQIVNESLLGDAVITSAKIKSLTADKLTAGVINTSLINMSSDAGHLKITDKTIQIYDDLDAAQNRKIRVQIGDLSSLGSIGLDKFGMVVFGKDGTTRLYDNTGVYNAGLHDNVISEEKIQDDAISERVIRAGAIITSHLSADSITAEKIGVDAILARNILAESITGAKIAGETIEGRSIKAGEIDAGHIKAGAITAVKIAANSITADKLTIGFLANIIRDGYDSFEQSEVGNFKGVILAGTAPGVITKDWSFDGDKSFFLMGNAVSNRVRLAVADLDYTIPVMPGLKYFVSAFVKTNSTNQVPLTLGMAYNNKTVATSTIKSVSKSDRVTRIFHEFTVPTGVLRASVVLGVEGTNVGVWFDCLQVEEAEVGQTEPGFWKSTATTKIDGANITTGRVDASRIHIGGGTVFGTNSDIIDITDAGIKAKSQTGFAMLNSKGLEIEGGAFSLKSGVLGQNSIMINGQDGILTETPLNRIEMNAITGFRIINKAGNKVLLDIDQVTGDVRLAGSMRIYDKDNPLMSWTMDEKIEGIEGSVNTVLGDYVKSADIAGLQDQIDGAIETWFGSYEPTLNNVPARDWKTIPDKDKHLGDLYFDDITGYSYRFVSKGAVYSWLLVKDTDVTLALQTASKAQDTADGKRRIFIVTPITPYDSGDLWAGGAGADLMRCVTSRATGAYNAADWQKASKYTDDTVANAAKQESTAAKGEASTAKAEAAKANGLLSDISNDNKLTAAEKKSLKVQWDSIISEFEKNKATAIENEVNTAEYHAAYTTLSSFIGTTLTDANLMTTSAINGVALRLNFKTYYDKRQILLDDIAKVLKMKSLELELKIEQSNSDNKTEVLQGTEIFTDTADDAVVHVEVDGKSVGGVSGKNLFIGTPNSWATAGSSVTITGEVIKGTPAYGNWPRIINATVRKIDFDLAKRYTLSMTVRADSTINRRAAICNTGSQNSVTSLSVPFTTSWNRVELSFTPQMKALSDVNLEIYTGNGVSLDSWIEVKDVQIEENPIATPYELPDPTLDYPIPINSLDKSFDIVSSVGGRNYLEGSNFMVEATSSAKAPLKSFGVITMSQDELNEVFLGKVIRLSYFVNSVGARQPDAGSLGNRFGIHGLIQWKDSTGQKPNTSEYPFAGALEGVFNNTRIDMATTVRPPAGYDRIVSISFSFQPLARPASGNNEVWKLGQPKLEVENLTPYTQAPGDITYNTQTPTIYKTNILLSEPLRSVGNVKDRLFRDTDGLWKVERNVGEAILDETYEWSLSKADWSREGFLNIEVKKPSKYMMWGRTESKNIKSNLFPSLINMEAYEETAGESITADAYVQRIKASLSRLVTPDLNGWKDFVKKKKEQGNPFSMFYELATPTTENLSQEFQIKLNNIQSFKGSNYVYTLHDKIGILPELKATFKSRAYYRYEKSTAEIGNLKQAAKGNKDINLGMKIGFSGFTTQAVNHIFFCGLEMNYSTVKEELADIDGAIFNRDTLETIAVPKQSLSLAGVPAGTSGYIIWDNTSKKLHFTYYTSVMGAESMSSIAWKTHTGAVINLTDSVYVLGEIEV